MPADASIFQQIQPVQAPNRLAEMAQAMNLQGSMNQNALAQYSLASAQRKDNEANQLSELYRTGGVIKPDGTMDESALLSGAAQRGLGSQIPGLQKQLVEARNTQAQADERKAQTKKYDMETAGKNMEYFGQAFGQLRTAPTLENANAVLGNLVRAGVLQPQQAEQIRVRFTADPSRIGQEAEIAYRSALSAKDQLPTIQTRNTGGMTDTMAIDPVTGVGRVTGSVRNTQSPDSVASNATSRANNRDTIAGENLRAGVSADGSVSPDVEAQAQAIAKGQLMPPSGAALINPKNAKVLARVMEINPQYDATTVLAKRKAAADFTSGTLGNALRSVSTANAHLDQLNELADAMQNGNTQVINRVGNYFSQQTGNPAVTNFDAIKQIVGQEVVKAIVAGGGGVGEREEAAKIFSSANSPAQLKGAIQHYRMVMGAQANNLMEQRRAAGLPDSTLPNYSTTNTPKAATPTIDPSAIAAELARRGVK